MPLRWCCSSADPCCGTLSPGHGPWRCWEGCCSCRCWRCSTCPWPRPQIPCWTPEIPRPGPACGRSSRPRSTGSTSLPGTGGRTSPCCSPASPGSGEPPWPWPRWGRSTVGGAGGLSPSRWCIWWGPTCSSRPPTAYPTCPCSYCPRCWPAGPWPGWGWPIWCG